MLRALQEKLFREDRAVTTAPVVVSVAPEREPERRAAPIDGGRWMPGRGIAAAAPAWAQDAPVAKPTTSAAPCRRIALARAW